MTDDPFWMKQYQIMNKFIKYAKIIIILLLIIFGVMLYGFWKIHFWFVIRGL